MQAKRFEGINFYEDELNNFREHPNVADVTTLATALEHAYAVLETNEAVIKKSLTLIGKMDEYYHARLELGDALRANDETAWEASKFIQDVRAREGHSGHTSDGNRVLTNRSDKPRPSDTNTS